MTLTSLKKAFTLVEQNQCEVLPVKNWKSRQAFIFLLQLFFKGKGGNIKAGKVEGLEVYVGLNQNG